MHELVTLIKEDMKPALGVTEPGAVAVAAAIAKSKVKGNIQHISISLSSGIYKNGLTCGVPNSNEVGLAFAAALGVVAGDPTKGLEALAQVSEADNIVARKLVKEGKVSVFMKQLASFILIDATVSTELDECTVKVRGSHTHIVEIIKNGETIYEGLSLKEASTQKNVVHQYALEELLLFVNEVPISDIGFIKDACLMNMELFEEGLLSEKTTFSKQLLKENRNQIISNDAIKTSLLLCGGAIEARVLGVDKPAMSITGSGSHGILATLPLFAYFKVQESTLTEESLIRAIALSYLVTMYIKEYSGKLSAFCGCGIAAGTGMACGLVYLQGGGLEELGFVIQNMASGITGMICDGGNRGCVMKGMVAVDAAYRSASMAIHKIAVEKIHGINGNTPEQTMYNMGQIASPGMEKTEEMILEIMNQKESNIKKTPLKN